MAMWLRRIPAGVCTLQLVLGLHCAVLVSSDAGSGSGNCSDNTPEPLLLSKPSTNITAGFILSSAGLCGGCVTGWSYCYYSMAGNKHSVSMTFALWRWSENESLKMVEGSSYPASMKSLPDDQWFACEQKMVHGGSEVMEGDMVGVVIDDETSLLHVVGEAEDGVIMVGDRKMGREGILSKTSLQTMDGHTLLVSAVTGVCGQLQPTSSTSSDPPTITNTPAPTSETTAGSGGIQQFWVVVVSAGLGVVIALLLIMTCFSITVSCRQRRLLQKRIPLRTVLLNGHRKFSGGNSDVDFEIHTLNTTTTSGSAHSTSLSPTPHVVSPAPHAINNGQASDSLWQPPRAEEQPLLLQQSPPPASQLLHHHSSPPASKKPPPVRPKPSSRMIVPQPQHDPRSPTPSLHQTTPTSINSDPPHHAALCRSYSEETIQIKRPQEERPNILLPRAPRSPRHLSVPNRVSTGSLPDFTSPSVDEDDYTIPTQHLFPRTYKRPQPYLQPHPIYSYAYTHVGSRELGTVPRKAAVPAVKQRSLSERTNPYDSIRAPLAVPHPQDLDYDEIFLERHSEEKTVRATGGHSVRTPPSSSSPRPVHTLHLVQSSPAGISHPPSNPLVSEQHRLMSTGSEGYVNENEYPRPGTSADLTPPPRKLHYTPLQPPLREECPTYETPSGGGSDGVPDPPLSPTDYDHLHSTTDSPRDSNHLI